MKMKCIMIYITGASLVIFMIKCKRKEAKTEERRAICQPDQGNKVDKVRKSIPTQPAQSMDPNPNIFARNPPAKIKRGWAIRRE